jgi:hypothetical protein
VVVATIGIDPSPSETARRAAMLVALDPHPSDP